MFARLGLRGRVFLAFLLLGTAAVLAMAAGLWLGYHRIDNPLPFAIHIRGWAAATFLVLSVIALFWLLFDRYFVRPVENIASAIRTRAHADTGRNIHPEDARHLRDLADAAIAATDRLTHTRSALAQTVARETARLSGDKARLEEILAAVPCPTLLCTGQHRVVFYNPAAQRILSEAGNPLCLQRSLFDYLRDSDIRAGQERLTDSGGLDTGVFPCRDHAGERSFAARLQRVIDNGGNVGAYILTLEATSENRGEEPSPAGGMAYVAHDFDLLSSAQSEELGDAPLASLAYVVFDTETTGLLPDKGDEIVQIAAVRIVNGRILQTETFDMLVNPGRAIPPAAIAVHGVSDAMVAEAPDIADVLGRFHRFADGAVLVAHNAPFDMAFLYRRERQIGKRFSNPVLDTVLLSAVVFGQWQNHSLDALALRLGVDLPPQLRHTAMGDATATAEVFLKLVDILSGKGIDRFDAVLAQVRRHSRLLKDLNRHPKDHAGVRDSGTA